MADKTPFGFSLALIDGDIAFGDSDQPTTGNGVTLRTLQLVSGRANLLQALKLRVLTAVGSDIFNTGYGLDVQDVFTQANTISLVKELLKLSLVRTLGTDPRVNEVRDIIFADDPLYLQQHPQLSKENIQQAIRSRFWRIDVIIETIEARTETLSLTLGV